MVLLALVAGALVGWFVAMRVNMIQIPAMVAFQHGAGGIAAFLISFVELTRPVTHSTAVGQLSGILGVAVGAATFSGSMVASARLSGIVRQSPTILPKHNWLVLGVLTPIVGLAVWAFSATGSALLLCVSALVLLSILLGVVFAIRIGGADMPVLISFLNATAGLAASFCGCHGARKIGQSGARQNRP